LNHIKLQGTDCSNNFATVIFLYKQLSHTFIHQLFQPFG